MKVLAIILNISVLAFFIFIIFDPKSKINAEEIPIMILVFSTPIVNIIALYKQSAPDSWISLFLKRKALEEKQKIATLTK